LVDEGLSQQTIGYFFAAPVVAAMIFGSLVGGRLADRTPRKRAVLIAVVFVSLTVAALALIDAWVAPIGIEADMETDPRSLSLLLCLQAMYFGIGLLTAASYALFMDITNKNVAATQFSAFMGATNGCESWSALAIGRMAGGWGYAAAFLAMSGLALLSLPVLALMRLGREGEENSVT
jgi:MFS family permease